MQPAVRFLAPGVMAFRTPADSLSQNAMEQGTNRMTAAALTGAPRLTSVADSVLKGAAALWLSAALAGQWAFFYYIVSFYGTSTLSGNLQTWNRLAVLGRHPYVAGDTGGNLAYAAHALAAGIIAFGGALQLMPQVRARAPVFHRWNGRLFLLTVTGLSLSGFYLVWVRHTSPDLVSGIATTLNGVLILTFAALALKSALARDFAVHRPWAMRLYLVSNGQWFLRVGLFAYFVVSRGLGAKVSFSDPVLQAWTWGCYLAPLAILELYLRAKASAGPGARLAMAGGLVALTLLMTVGIVTFSIFSQLIVSGAPVKF